jgi:hypothetical protein
MRLEATITQQDLTRMMAEVLPVKIHLHHEGEEPKTDRWLFLHPATQLTLVPEEGLRVTCSAELSWTLAGVGGSVKIDELRVLVRPQVVERHKGDVLEFQLEVEEANFRMLPNFIDNGIVKALNAVLATKKLPWTFADTLSRVVGLGNMFEPVEALRIKVLRGRERIDVKGLTFAIDFELGFVRGD